MQHEVMGMRMQPVANLFNKLPRMVRDLARTCHKRVRLEVDGRNTELDKSLMEAIKDPMTHLLRNCIDHGIELPDVRAERGKNPEGRIFVRAFHQNGLVHVEVSDDGAGIALDKVRSRAITRGLFVKERVDAMSDSEVASLIFLPGFSTAAEVTTVSGRGVGMDVVKTNVEQIGGTVEVESRSGRGATFTLKVPLTLAIVPALITMCGGHRYAIPQVNVVEVLRLSTIRGESSVEWFHGAPVYRLRGKLLPLIFLQETLGLGRPNTEPAPDDVGATALHMTVLHAAGRFFGLVVDAVIDQQEIVAKPLPPQLRSVHAFSGATLLGDGRVALILDALAIAQKARVAELRDDGVTGRSVLDATAAEGLRTLLLFGGPDDERFGVPMESLSRLETIEQSAVESAGPQEVIQYRNGLLPIFRIEDLLPERRSRIRNPSPQRAAPRNTIDILVLADGARSLGLIVDDVLDVVETGQGMRRQGCREGVEATVVLHGRVTEVLDVRWLVTAALGAAEFVEELML
jgi:two-component system chemotaxis sensor kinase CheA